MSKAVSITTTVVVLVLIILGAWYFMASRPTTQSYAPTNSGATTNSTQSQVKGTMYITITDAAVNMQNITKVDMTVDKVEAYSPAQGWVTLSSNSQTFNLLELKAKGQTALLAKIDVPADTYSQIRLHVAQILVTESGEVKEAKVPSNEFKIMADVAVRGNANSVARFDILADKSVHKTGKGEFIFTPVIKFDSSSDVAVQVGVDNMVTVSGGNANASANFGMDINGQVKQDFMLDTSATLTVTGGVIEIK